MQQNTLAPWAEVAPDVQYPLTEDHLLSLQDDEWNYELVDGRLVRMAPTGLEHLDITERLYETLRTFVLSRGLGRVTLPDTGFRLSKPGEPDTVLSPNVAFVSNQRTQ